MLTTNLTMEQFENLEVGDAVHDMHYGINYLNVPKELEIVNHTQWYIAGKQVGTNVGSAFIQSITGKQPSNKMAVVVGMENLSGGRGGLVFNYSYDGRYFGTFVIRRKMVPRGWESIDTSVGSDDLNQIIA
jgi:hypothetical protein